MKTFNKYLVLLLMPFVFAACTKSNDPEPDKNAPGTAVSGKITYKLDGKAMSYDGTGYVLATDHSFVKWESGKEQLSIDFFGMAAGSYTYTTDLTKVKGNARITYYPENGSTTVWKAKAGTFTVTSYSSTSGFKASGTFTATIEKYVADKPTGDKMEITSGVFTDIMLRDTR